MSSFTGQEFLRIWEAGKPQGLSQRKLASVLGVNFNSLHGKLFRAQKKPIEGDYTLHTYDNVFLRAAIVDIECMDFSAGGVRDHVVCASFLPLDEEEPYTIAVKFDDARCDKRVLSEICESLVRYDILIGHNLSAFDTNWLTSRMMYHRLPSIGKRFLIYDTYQAARRMAIKADRKSLSFLCDFFRIEHVKTMIAPVSWGMIDSPLEEEFNDALADITYHCEQDVIANRRLFNALYPRDNKLKNLPVKEM